MTTSRLVDVECPVCGTEAIAVMLMSTTIFGSPTLDGRPAPPHGYWVDAFVAECQGCGYAAPFLSKPSDEVKSLVLSDAFKNARSSWPGLMKARKFHSMAWLHEKTGNLRVAFKARLMGAWTCDGSHGMELSHHPDGRPLNRDDEDADGSLGSGQDGSEQSRAEELRTLLLAVRSLGEDEGADGWLRSGHDGSEQFRREAIRTVQIAHAQGETVTESKEEDLLFCIDLHRRIGEFDEAEELCVELLSGSLSERMAALVEFHRGLIADQDAGCYTLADAIPPSAQDIESLLPVDLDDPEDSS